MTSSQDIHFRLCERGEFAELTVEASVDPTIVTVENLTTAAQVAGIAVTSSVHSRLDQVAHSFNQRPRRICKVVATSTNPVHGTDGYLQWEPKFDRVTKPMSKRTRPLANPTRVNHYAGLHYVDVKAGDHVATIIPPTEGTEGIDVCGQPIKARSGTPCDVRIDASLSVDESGRVVSSREGTLQFERKVLRVDDVLTVSGCVDFTTGNIQVNGSVEIREHVRAMFVVKATHDVTVGGLVEAATINCQRNFYCRRGMVAKGRGKLNIGADAEVGYLNDARGTIGRNLILHREAIDCELVVNGEIRGESATIIGGTTRVAGACTIGTIGSRGGKITVIEPQGPLQVLRMIYHGVILRLCPNPGVVVEAILRDPVQGAVRLSRDTDGQWCFITAQNSTLPLASVADVKARKAA